MGITPMFSKHDIEKRCDNFIERVVEEEIKLLRDLAEQCMTECKTNHNYKDNTGNLSASMGYMIIYNNQIIRESFEGESEAGRKKGQEFAHSLTELYHEDLEKGLMLVVVAGMHYAIYVESKGFNVLSSAEHLAERELPRMLKDLTDDMKKE